MSKQSKVRDEDADDHKNPENPQGRKTSNFNLLVRAYPSAS